MKTGFRKTLAALLILSSGSFGAPAYADVSRQAAREQLIRQGVATSDAQARVAALTHDEAVEVAAEFANLPAGGRGEALLGLAVVAIVGAIVIVKLLPVIVAGGVSVAAIKASGSAAVPGMTSMTADNP